MHGISYHFFAVVVIYDLDFGDFFHVDVFADIVFDEIFLFHFLSFFNDSMILLLIS